MKRRNGYTLVEVLISMMLTAVMVGAVFSVAITGQQSGNKVDRHVIANQYSRHLSEALAAYVVDANSYTTANNALIAGPASTTPGTASWAINGTLGEDGRSVVDSMGAVWALTPGNHILTGYLPLWFEGAPYNATISYLVTAKAVGGVGVANQAQVHINWTEP